MADITGKRNFFNERYGMKLLALAGGVSAIGLLTWWMAVRADHEMRDELLRETLQATKVVDSKGIQALAGTGADLDRPEYQQLKEQLAAVRSVNRQCRFTYLLGRQPDHTVFFFADSEPPDSKDYSPPGQVYEEVPDEDRRVFDTNVAIVEGPSSDRWGTWVSALIPLTDPRTGAVLAVLGMDVEASAWHSEVATRVALPVGLILVLVIVGAVVWFSNRRVEISPRPVLRRLLWPLAGVVTLLMVGAGALLVLQQRHLLDREIAADLADAMSDLQLAVEQGELYLAASIKPIAADPAVQNDLRAGDVDHLLATWRPVLEAWQRENHLTHLSFFDKHRVCLLRINWPDIHGERVERFTAREAERTGKLASGLELGKMGNFTLRVVQPVFADGQLVGYVELGQDIEDILHSLRTRSSNQLAVIIHKEFLNRPTWEEYMRQQGRKPEWERLPNNVVLYATQGRLPDAFVTRIGHSTSAPVSGNLEPELAFEGKFWQISGHPLKDAAGQEVADLLVMRDITAYQASFIRVMVLGGSIGGILLALLLGFIYVLLRRTDAGIRAQQATLRESESRHRTILHTALEGFGMVDLQGCLQEVNAAYCRMSGYSASELLGKRISDLEVVENEADTAAHMHKVRTAGQDRFETRHRRKDGRVIDIEVSVHYRSTDNYMVVFLHDITDRKRLETALREREDNLAALFEDAPVGYHELDRTGHIVQVNRTQLAMLGYSAEEMLGHPIWEFTSEREKSRVSVQGLLAGQGASSGQVERIFQCKDGTTLTALVEYRLLHNAAGQLIGIRSTLVDITLRKQYEGEIERLNRFYTVISQIDQALVHLRNRDELLAEICRVLASHSFFKLAWIGWCDRATQAVVPIAQHGDQLGYLRQVNIYYDDRLEGRGPTGTAIREGRPYVSNDCARDPRLQPWQATMARHAIAAAIGLPIRIEGEVVGALTVYSSQANVFGPKKVALLEGAASDISFALEKLAVEDQRRQAEDELRESRAQFQQLLHQSPLPLAVYNDAGIFEIINERATELTGYTQEEVPNLEVWMRLAFPDESYRRESWARWEKYLATVAEGRQVAPPPDFQVTCKDGTVRTMEMFSRWIGNKNIAILNDITERRRVEEALRESNLKFQQVIENIKEVFWVADADLRTILFISPTFETVWGRTCASLYQNPKAWIEAIHPDDRPWVISLLRHRGTGGFNVEYRIIRPDGTERWIWDRGYPIKNETGAVERIAGIAEDITARKTMEKTLRKNEEAFRLAFEEAKDAIIWVDPQSGIMLQCNRAAEVLLERSRAELHRQPVSRLVPPENLADFSDDFGLATIGKQAFFTNIVLLSKSGRRIPCDVSTSRTRLGAQDILQGVFRDVTARQRVEEQMRMAKEAAEVANYAKDMFLANMSHELRTPMNGILGMTELLLETNLDADQKDCAATIYRSGEALLNILNDVLDLTQLRVGRIALEEKPFEPAQVVNDVVELFRPKLTSPKVDLAVWVDPELPNSLRGDPARLRQILVNLVSNAVKFTSNGWIAVGVQLIELLGNQVCLLLSVQDTGEGIPSEFLPHMYMPFTQADISHTRRHSGMGLGLTNTKKLVELMGGTLEAVSAQGVGTTFAIELTLPLVQAELPAPDRQPAAHKSAGPGTGGRVLLVEDNPGNIKTLRKVLTKLGYQATSAVSGEEALMALEKEDYDLVLMDIQLPGMNGYETTQAIRAREAGTGRRLPIIALTAFVMKGDRERCLAAGLDDYLGKPVKLEKLQDMLNRWSGRSAAPSVAPALMADPQGSLPAPSERTFDDKRVAQLKAIFPATPDEYLDKALHPFMLSLDTHLVQMAELIQKEEWRRLAEEAHRLSGTASNVGAAHLAKLTKQMVSQALLSGAEEVHRLLAEMQREAVNIKGDIVRMGMTTER